MCVVGDDCEGVLETQVGRAGMYCLYYPLLLAYSQEVLHCCLKRIPTVCVLG